jgi:uncharacterized GH25 family protein
MQRKHVAIGLAVVAVAVLGNLLLSGGGKSDDDKSTAASGSKRDRPTLATGATDRATQTSRGIERAWTLDPDPEGPLRLDGQVVDRDGNGVGDAEVTLSSEPSRTAKTQGDGSFAFDGVVGRGYELSARKGALIGEAHYKLTAQSPPVVIRVGAGAALDIAVTGDDGKPIAGADVASGKELTARTNDDGRAKLEPLHPGWIGVHVTASGYAPASAFATVGSANATGKLDVRLHRGTSVSGRVVDEAGKPIANARVQLSSSWGSADGDAAHSNDTGEFTIAAVAAGAHTLSATAADHAPVRSSPVTVADRPVAGIEIKMKAGGVVYGTVTDAAGKPVPFATIRVAAANRQMWEMAPRQATTNRQGAFELRGLARAKLQARAESDASASQIVDVDLAATQRKEVKLVLDVAGTIAGIVVDDTGKPVPEVQVSAFPDVFAGGDTSAMMLGGLASATSDGAGGFTIRGLADGAYKVSAARAGASPWRDFGEHGTTARVGDQSVRVVLATPGELRGRLVVAGASTPPKLASIAIGYQPPTPANADGTFALLDVAPGTYDVHFRGADFAEKVQRDVKIEPGKPTDLGTVEVLRGRRVTGKVVDSSGSPVAGAKVRCGDVLWSLSGADDQSDSFGAMSGIRSTTSDQDGAFVIVGVSAKPMNVGADHPDRGSSIAQKVPGGADDPPPVTLSLHGLGSIAGKVTMKGQPQSGVTVMDSPKGGGEQVTIVQTDADGNFAFPKAVEGAHVLNVMRSSGGFANMGMKTTSATVQVTAGQQASAAIDIPVGVIALTVQITALPGNKVDSAQVWLFGGSVTATSSGQLAGSFLQGSIKGMKLWMGGTAPSPEFDELVPGDYTVCVIPITGNIADPSFQQRLQQHQNDLAVYCKPLALAPSPNAQTVAEQVPSMSPLPPS